MIENKRPALTIGLSFFNNQSTLADAIKSVLLQTFEDWELILIDDGSTDNSYQVAKKFADKDRRIKLISDGTNRGLIHRLNQIIDLAETDYIARMDSDDMMMPEKLEKQMKVLLQNKDVDVIDTAVYTINEKDVPIGFREADDLRHWDSKRILRQALLFHATIIAKLSWYKQNKYDEDFVRSEDFELWCRTFTKTVFYRINEPLFIYREGNVNIKNYVTSNRTHRKILRKYAPGTMTKKELILELFKTHFKSFLYKLFAIFNCQYILSSKRNIKLNESEIILIQRTIQLIKNSI